MGGFSFPEDFLADGHGLLQRAFEMRLSSGNKYWQQIPAFPLAMGAWFCFNPNVQKNTYVTYTTN
jgi:hypothetical protein